MKNSQKKSKRVKSFFRFFFGLCASAFSIFFLEGLYFVWVLNIENSTAPSDAILIFMGTNKRIEAGYELANKGVASRIVLSPATVKYRQSCDRKYALKDTVVHIPEDQAISTFQNALYISRIINAHHLKTVTLVTSDYHMPRSLALMRLFLIGEGVKVQLNHVRGFNTPADTVAVNVTRLKLVYKEMVKFWGSMYAFISWQITGVISKEPRKNSGLSSILRSLILLDWKYAW